MLDHEPALNGDWIGLDWLGYLPELPPTQTADFLKTAAVMSLLAYCTTYTVCTVAVLPYYIGCAPSATEDDTYLLSTPRTEYSPGWLTVFSCNLNNQWLIRATVRLFVVAQAR